MDYSFLTPLITTIFFSTIPALFYYHKFLKRDLAIAIILYSTFIFSIVFFISFQNNIGLGIGLFAILSLIRLRSNLDNLIDVSFIFYSISIGLINGSISTWPIMVVLNFVLCFLLIFLSSDFVFNKKIVKTQIIFDEIIFEKLGTKDISLLKKKIKKDYDISAIDLDIVNINYLRDTVTLEITYNARNH